MKKMYVFIIAMIGILGAEALTKDEATVEIMHPNLSQGDVGHNVNKTCGDYDGDGKIDVLIDFDNGRVVVYSYAKGINLLEVRLNDSSRSYTSFGDLDGDGDTEIIIGSLIFDYASDGTVIKK